VFCILLDFLLYRHSKSRFNIWVNCIKNLLLVHLKKDLYSCNSLKFKFSACLNVYYNKKIEKYTKNTSIQKNIKTMVKISKKNRSNIIVIAVRRPHSFKRNEVTLSSINFGSIIAENKEDKRTNLTFEELLRIWDEVKGFLTGEHHNGNFTIFIFW